MGLNDHKYREALSVRTGGSTSEVTIKKNGTLVVTVVHAEPSLAPPVVTVVQAEPSLAHAHHEGPKHTMPRGEPKPKLQRTISSRFPAPSVWSCSIIGLLIPTPEVAAPTALVKGSANGQDARQQHTLTRTGVTW